jgi:Ni,Fe-hydrogenase maturation factor
MAADERSRTLVLGIGNILLRDEGAGVQVVNRLAELNPDAKDIVWMDGGTLSFTLARALVGIQPEAIEWGEEPTQAVADALPVAQRAIAGLVERWTGVRLTTD